MFPAGNIKELHHNAHTLWWINALYYRATKCCCIKLVKYKIFNFFFLKRNNQQSNLKNEFYWHLKPGNRWRISKKKKKFKSFKRSVDYNCINYWYIFYHLRLYSMNPPMNLNMIFLAILIKILFTKTKMF